MKKVIALLSVCLCLSGCAYMFGAKETGADKRPEEGYRQPGGYRNAEDVASGTTKEERAFGLR